MALLAQVVKPVEENKSNNIRIFPKNRQSARFFSEWLRVVMGGLTWCKHIVVLDDCGLAMGCL